MAHVRRMRELYRARRDIFLDELERQLAGRLLPGAAAGGLQMSCLPPDQRHSDRRLSAAADAAGIDLPPLSRLCLGPQARQGFVMGFSALAPGQIRDAMKRLAAAWQR